MALPARPSGAESEFTGSQCQNDVEFLRSFPPDEAQCSRSEAARLNSQFVLVVVLVLGFAKDSRTKDEHEDE